LGKLAAKELKKMLDCIKKDERVLVPPMVGYDAGVHRLGSKLVAVATDPCTGVPAEWFGWLLINYAASDLALFGVKAEFCTINLLGPKQTTPATFQKIMRQTCKAADELDIAIVRGHTGMYDSLTEMLGVCTVYGTAVPERLITPGNVKASDLILCTKPLGLETITNFSLTHKVMAQKLFTAKKQKEYAKLVHLQSCVKEALKLAQITGVHALHDATEGGVAAALNELAEASKVGFKVDWEKIPFPSEASPLKYHFGLNDKQLLSMSSTGTILAAISLQAKAEVEEALKTAGLGAFFIGEFTQGKKRVLVKGGKETVFPVSAVDPYTKIMETKD
jgi:hydrogenase expression/formation protein HypE